MTSANLALCEFQVSSENALEAVLSALKLSPSDIIKRALPEASIGDICSGDILRAKELSTGVFGFLVAPSEPAMPQIAEHLGRPTKSTCKIWLRYLTPIPVSNLYCALRAARATLKSNDSINIDFWCNGFC